MKRIKSKRQTKTYIVCAALLFAFLSMGLWGCADDEAEFTKVKLRILDKDGTFAGSKAAPIIDPAVYPAVGVIVKVTAPDLGSPLTYSFSPSEVRDNQGIVAMLVPSGPSRTFSPAMFEFYLTPQPNEFPGAVYLPDSSAASRTVDLTGEITVFNIDMVAAPTVTLQGVISDDRTGPLAPIEACANHNFLVSFRTKNLSRGTIPIDVTDAGDGTGNYSIINVPTGLPLVLAALDPVTRAYGAHNLNIPFGAAGPIAQDINLGSADRLTLLPTSVTVEIWETVNFTASNGFPPLIFSVIANNSNGNITPTSPTTADYTAGDYGDGVVDVVQVTDNCSAVDTAEVTVNWRPLTISPTSASLVPFGTQVFSATGGSGDFMGAKPTRGKGGSQLMAVGGSPYYWDFADKACPASTLIPSGSVFGFSEVNYVVGDSSNCTDIVRLSDDAGATPVTATVTVGSLPANWYVDDSNIAGPWDGLTWATAFADIPSAAAAAVAGEVVFVAEGTYIPGGVPTDPILTMPADVKWYGGFLGTENNLSQRGDPSAAPSVLDGQNTSCSVVLGANNVVLDGFSVINGDCTFEAGGMHNDTVSNLIVNNSEFYNNYSCYGGGMYNLNSTNVTISNTIFDFNNACYVGGGMLNKVSSTLDIANCLFINNFTDFDEGGGMYNYDSSPMISYSYFIGNYASSYGGGMYNAYMASPSIYYSKFKYNSASSGGAMYNYDNVAPIISNTVFIDNTAVDEGGAIMNDSNADPLLSNCIIAFNSVTGASTSYGGGMNSTGNSSPQVENSTFFQNYSKGYGGAIWTDNYSATYVRNSIFWGDYAVMGYSEIGYQYSAPGMWVYVDYSDIYGGYAGPGAGVGNINNDPLFVNVPLFREYTNAAGTTTTIEVPDATKYNPAAPEIIEINNDGVGRTVTVAAGTTVTFTPALGSPSVLGDLVENWGPGAVLFDLDFHLQGGSFCIDAGDPNPIYNDAFGQGTATNDMGAYGGPGALP